MRGGGSVAVQTQGGIKKSQKSNLKITIKILNLMQQIKLELYQRVYRYALNIIRFAEDLPKSSSTDILVNQLLRSGTSISANIIEAKAASSNKDYINFYNYALKSANETKLWLALIRDTTNTAKIKAEDLIKETVELANIIGASILTMKNKR